MFGKLPLPEVGALAQLTKSFPPYGGWVAAKRRGWCEWNHNSRITCFLGEVIIQAGARHRAKRK